MPTRGSFANSTEFFEALRDYFAGQVLTGILANTQYSAYGVKLNDEFLNIEVAAYKMADAMIKERIKGAS